MELEPQNEKRSGAGKIIVIIALIVLVVADVFLLYQLFDQGEDLKKKEKRIALVTKENDSLKYEIENLQNEINNLKKQLEELGESNTTKEQEIAKLQATVNRMRSMASGAGGSDPKVLAKLKKELAAAKEEKNRTANEFETLRREKESLAARAQMLSDSLDGERKTTEKVKKDKGLVDKRLKESQALKADNIVAMPLKVKSSGKEIPVTKASKVTKVQIAFKLQQNLATDAGAKTVYMRVLGPDRSVITSNANETFSFDGDNLPYTEKKEINYDNKDTDVKLNFKKGNTAYTKGTYTVELYEGGVMIGKTTFTLK